jgi:hypothetical protein
MAVLPVGIGSEEGDYQIERSLRFNSADSAYLNRTPASAGNRKTFTYSCWVKRGLINAAAHTFGITAAAGGSDPRSEMEFDGTANEINIGFNPSGSQWFESFTNAVFRDPSAWYHIVVSVDMTQATDTNRLKVYVNGVVQTFRVYSVPSQNTDLPINNNIAHSIGRYQAGGTSHLNGYLTEINFIDGQALTPSSFGEFNSDTGVWQPKKYTGTYGTNGFYLNFSDNSGTTSTTLGADSSGNGNNWTPNNFSVTAGAGNDSLVDSPTRYGTDTGAGGEVRGNYATLNVLAKGTSQAITNGNLDIASTSTVDNNTASTIGMSSGKWYFEVTITNIGSGEYAIGLGKDLSPNTVIGVNATSWSYAQTGQVYTNASLSAYGASYTTNDVLGAAFDADAGTLVFYKNGVSQGTAATGITNGPYFFLTGTYLSGSSRAVNFGQRPFAYTAPSGFKALVTTNLPTPTIENGGEYFNAVLYTGTGVQQNITGVGFQPDFVWAKMRSGVDSHVLVDKVRGDDGTRMYVLCSNQTGSEADRTEATTAIVKSSSWPSDGFTVGTNGQTNGSGSTYVGWAWKANGAGVSNTDGTITSTVSVNTTSGFSIVTYTGTGSGGTIGHGLGVAPEMIILKNRDRSIYWSVYTKTTGINALLRLNTTDASVSSSGLWGSTAPTSTVFGISGTDFSNGSVAGEKIVAYCFAPVAGYSAFGSYTGNGSADGPFVYTGFRPRWIMWKRTDSATGGVWVIQDTARRTFNPMETSLYPNLSNAEATGETFRVQDTLSNGFKIRASAVDCNASGGTYIYAAFAENPFSIALAR